jgi:hypothetical protein
MFRVNMIFGVPHVQNLTRDGGTEHMKVRPKSASFVSFRSIR